MRPGGIFYALIQCLFWVSAHKISKESRAFESVNTTIHLECLSSLAKLHTHIWMWHKNFFATPFYVWQWFMWAKAALVNNHQQHTMQNWESFVCEWKCVCVFVCSWAIVLFKRNWDNSHYHSQQSQAKLYIPLFDKTIVRLCLLDNWAVLIVVL